MAMDRALENQKYTLFKRKGMNTELNFFKGQKNEAERFKRLQKERDGHVLHDVLWKLFHLDKKILDDTKELDKTTGKVPALKKELGEQEKLVKKRRTDQAQAQAEILEQKKAIRGREKELEKQQPDLDAIDVKIKLAQTSLSDAEKIVKDVEPGVVQMKATVAGYERDYATAKEAADRVAREQARIAEAQGTGLSEQDLARYHELKAEASSKAVVERQELGRMQRDIQSEQSKMNTLNGKLDDVQRRRDRLQGEVADYSGRKAGLEGQRNEIQQSLNSLRAASDEATRKLNAIREREDKVNETLAGCLSKLSEANVLQKEHEKERKKAEQVKVLQQKVSGVHGRLSTLCKPTQSKYDVAISTILGRNADAIIVETQRDAIECIDHLKISRLGQATFIPLDTAQVKEINDRLRSLSTGARLAFDVIDYKEEFKRAMQYACGNSLVCDSMAIARSICYEKKVEVKAVTLEGTVIHKNGLISGGQSGEARIKRWEDREVKTLEKQRDECFEELKKLGQQRHEVDREGKNTTQVTQLEVKMNALRDELSNVNTQLKGKQDEMTALDKQIAQLTPQVASAKQTLDEAIEKAAALKATVDAEDDAVFAAFCQRIGVNNIREYEERQHTQSEENAIYELQMKRLEHSITFGKADLQRDERRLEINKEKISKRTEQISELKQERRSLRKALDSIIAEIDEMKESLGEMQSEEAKASEALRKARQEAQQVQSKLDSNAKEVASLHLDLELLATERLKLYRRCRLEEINLPLQSGSKKLNSVPLEEQVSLTSGEVDDEDSMDLDGDEASVGSVKVPDYGIKVDFAALSKAEKQDGSEEMGRDLEMKIEAAASELDKMTPNVRANDRLADTESRLAEVDSEFEKARREAKKAQDEYTRLRKLRCDLFNKAFDHISSKIDHVYKELTKSKISPKGGSAYLVLENSEEPYLGGLQFSAIPPAKTFRGIDHLSGGEKTMAAVALLFAVQSVFPAPFIVLDEVDAALDSINVQRVADYIRSRASNELQFIVISHKASLYERSSALIGVYRNQHIKSSGILTLGLEQYA